VESDLTRTASALVGLGGGPVAREKSPDGLALCPSFSKKKEGCRLKTVFQPGAREDCIHKTRAHERERDWGGRWRYFSFSCSTAEDRNLALAQGHGGGGNRNFLRLDEAT